MQTILHHMEILRKVTYPKDFEEPASVLQGSYSEMKILSPDMVVQKAGRHLTVPILQIPRNSVDEGTCGPQRSSVLMYPTLDAFLFHSLSLFSL